MKSNPPGAVTRAILHPTGLRYTLAHPSGFQPNQAMPLILALHWGGTVTPFYGESILLGLIQPALAGLDTYICAPDCDQGDWTDPAFQSALIEFLDRLIETYAIDRERILITGYSIGGIGTWDIASQYMSMFAGGLPISAPVPESALAADWQIPLCVIHSQQDELFAYQSTQRAVQALAERGVDIQFIAVDGPSHFETYGFIRPLQGAAAWIRRVWSLPGTNGTSCP